MTFEQSGEREIPKMTGLRRYHRTMAHTAKTDRTAVERRAAIERTRGMFAHLAPGESLADELIADRRAEVHAEELQETEQRRRRGPG